MFKRIIGILIVVFMIGGGAAGITSATENMSLKNNIKEAIGNVNKVTMAQSEVDVLRELFRQVLAEERAARNLTIGYCENIGAMAVIDAEIKNIRKIHLMNYMLCKRVLYVRPEAVNHYITINFAMLERSIYEIKLTADIIKNQLEYVKNEKAIELVEKILSLEEGIINHFYSFYKVFNSE